MDKLELSVVEGTAMEAWMLKRLVPNLRATLQAAKTADDEQVELLTLQNDGLLDSLESKGDEIMRGLAALHALGVKGKRFVNNERKLADYTNKFDEYIGGMMKDAALAGFARALAQHSKK